MKYNVKETENKRWGVYRGKVLVMDFGTEEEVIRYKKMLVQQEQDEELAKERAQSKPKPKGPSMGM